MRIVIVALAFWLVVPASARAGYLWLGDWQVDNSTTGSSLTDSGGAAVGVTGPSSQGGDQSSIAFSRQFEITDAPAGGLAVTLNSGFDASVLYFPRSFGNVVGSVMIDGDPASSLSFSFTPPSLVYGNTLTFQDSATRQLTLADGVYTVRGSLTSSADAYMNPFAPAKSSGDLTVSLADGTNLTGELNTNPTVVPEPPAAILAAVGIASLLALRLRR